LVAATPPFCAAKKTRIVTAGNMQKLKKELAAESAHSTAQIQSI